MAIQKKSLVGKTTSKDTTPAKAKTAGPTKQKMETTSKISHGGSLSTLKTIHNQ